MVVTAIVHRADQHCGAGTQRTEREGFNVGLKVSSGFSERTYIAIRAYNGIMTIRYKKLPFEVLANNKRMVCICVWRCFHIMFFCLKHILSTEYYKMLSESLDYETVN